MELHEIIDRSFEGDVQAFSELVRRYRDMAFGYALTLVRREQTAEDAVQEAMVVAYANLDQLREPRAFGAWLRGIVRHQCYRALRAEPAMVSWDSMDGEGDCNGPRSGTAVQSEMCEQVDDAMQALKPELREVVLLHYQAGLSQHEIAVKLTLTVGTVNMRLHAARSRIKRRLGLMADNNLQSNNTGRILEVNGKLATIQFAPNAVPPILTRLCAQAEESLCVIQHGLAGRVVAVSPRLGAIWTPGQEVSDTGLPFVGTLDMATIVQVVNSFSSQRLGAPLPSGIKAIDVFAPLTQSGTTGIFTEWGLGVLVLLAELVHHLDKDNNRQTFFVFVPPLSGVQHWNELTAEITVGSTNVSILYLPVADPIQTHFVDSITGLDAKIVLSRHLAEQALWPCIDPLACWSKRLERTPDDPSQPALVKDVRELLRTYYALQFSIDDADRRTLTAGEHVKIQRARKALRFLSQPFFVAEPYTKRPGEFVTAEAAKSGFADILAGKYDSTNKDAFYMIGAVPRT